MLEQALPLFPLRLEVVAYAYIQTIVILLIYVNFLMSQKINNYWDTHSHILDGESS